MYNKALAVLKIFNDNGYLAYVVGGYPRDYLLHIKTNDIDICTNAKPMEIMRLFETNIVDDTEYGSVKISYKGSTFDVTTFRKDVKYENNRKPVKIKYVSELKKDLLRRDFTINTMCIDSDGHFIDLLGAKKDIDNRIIATVGNPRYRLKEDSLRILRAVRFASVLDFNIDEKTKHYIKKYGYLLSNLSGFRKKEELDKILTSRNKEKGRKLLIELGLDRQLGFNNLKDIILCDDIIGIWSQLELNTVYPFSKLEKETISKIKEMMKLDIDNESIYKYGLYISTVVGSIKGVSYQKINNIYHNLVIYSKKDINIKAMEIVEILELKPGSYLKDILDDIEHKIVVGEIENEHDKLVQYVKDNY